VGKLVGIALEPKPEPITGRCGYASCPIKATWCVRTLTANEQPPFAVTTADDHLCYEHALELVDVLVCDYSDPTTRRT